MKPLPILGVVLFALASTLPLNADAASAAYKRGAHAENANHYDQAYEAYLQAHNLKPKDPRYFAAYARMRFYVAVDHVRSGQQLRLAGKLEEALQEFQLATQIDETNFVAKDEMRQTEELIRKQGTGNEPAALISEPLVKQAQNAAGPVELQPLTHSPINLRLTESAVLVYKSIGKLAGINVLVDSDYKSPKLTIELNNVTLREALDAVALQSKSFWQATSSNTIFVAADTPAKRKEIQSTSMKAFYLKNVSTAAELQEAANTLKGILDINRIQLVPAQDALILRGTPDQMVLAALLLQDIDKPKSEVMVDIAVLQVSRNRLHTLGGVMPTSVSITPTTANSTTGSAGGSGSNAGFTLNSLPTTASNFLVSIPSYSFTALANDSDTKVIQKPQVWVLNDGKASLKIGDRIPIATGSFGSTVGTQGFGPLVQTQFQYIDVGVNIDISPHIHSDKEVTLKMSLEISSVTGSTNIGGISQPTIGQRRIDLESRLRDGDINLVGGILEDSETKSLSGYPALLKVPILKYLFGQEDKQRQENEIVFAIMPHIVRAQQLTDENLRLVDLGAGNTVTVRRTETDSKKSGASPALGTPEQGALRDDRPVAASTQANVRATPPAQNPSEPALAPGTTHFTSPLTPTKPSPPGNSGQSAELRPEVHNRRPGPAGAQPTVRATPSRENPPQLAAGLHTTHSTSLLPPTKPSSPDKSVQSAELRFEVHNRAEKTASVWVDGQYVGYAKDLTGKKVLLLPGKHEVVVRQTRYEDYVEQPMLEPGEVHLIRPALTLVKDGRVPRNDGTGELKIAASPASAVVFVDDVFAGHANESAAKGMRLTPGSHRLRIALPGYLPFETVVDLHPHQKLTIETQLEKGRVQELNDENLPRVGGNAVTVRQMDGKKSTAAPAPGAPKEGALSDGREETAVTHAAVRASSSPENSSGLPPGSDRTHSTSPLPPTRSALPRNSTRSAELRFETHNRAEKTAGVWVDGQYAGYVKELAGSKKVLLVPGKHEIVVRQPWYEDYVEQPVLQPGEVHLISLALVKDGRAPRNDANGELKIDASPARAAVFVDGAFAGHADEFAGVGNALLLTPGEHRLRIALPGYQPFEAVVGLRPHQKLKVETHLEKEGVQESGAPAGQPGRAPASGSAFAVDGTTNAQ